MRNTIGYGALLLAACGGGPRAGVYNAVHARDIDGALGAYSQYRDVDGSDAQLLGEIAALVLEDAAIDGDEAVRDAALTQLRLAGTKGRDVLERLSKTDANPMTRVRALEALTRRGDREARAYLYGLLDSDDPQVVASAIAAIDADRETDRLLQLLRDPAAEVRKSAALQLGSATESAEARQGLSTLARVDSEAGVRGAAVRALGGFGPAAVSILRERLGDPDSQVRLAVVRALIRADRAEALRLVGTLLGTPPSPAGIEAARVIALTADEERPEGARDARAYLRAALLNEATTIRSQAAIALVSLPADSETDQALIQALEGESEAGVRLGLARALHGREVGGDEATAVLESLLSADNMPGVQAASLLARTGHEHAIATLSDATKASVDSLLRRVAARGLAREAMKPDAVRELLRDEDALVRVHAAGGILAAASAA